MTKRYLTCAVIFLIAITAINTKPVSASSPVMTWDEEKGFVDENGDLPDALYQLSTTTLTRTLHATTTVSAPPAPSNLSVSVINYDNEGEMSCYSLSGGTTDYEIYAYRIDGNGTKVFSTDHLGGSYTSPDEDGNPYIAHISWDASNDTETKGYEIFSDACGSSELLGKDVGDVVSYDDYGTGYEDTNYPPAPNVGENPSYYTSSIDPEDKTIVSPNESMSLAIANGEIAVSHTDGSVTGYISYANNDVSRGYLLMNVASSSIDGDILYMSPHVFEISLDLESTETGLIDEKRGDTGSISIHGSGKDQTYIKSNGQFIYFGNNSNTTDLSIVSTHPLGSDSSPFMDSNQPSPITATLRNIRTQAQADGIFTMGQVRDNLNIYNWTCSSNQDCVNWAASVSGIPSYGGTLNIFHSSLTSVASTSIGAGLYARGLLSSDGTVNIFNSTLQARDGLNLNCGIYRNGGTINVYGGIISSICNGSVNVTPNTIVTDGVAYNGSINIISPILPIISTSTPTNIASTSVTLRATLDADGGATTTIEGFNYGTTTAYGHMSYTSGLFNYNDFSEDISDLTCGTTYHYQAFAVNNIGTTTAADQTFTTLSCPQQEQPQATTTPTTVTTRQSSGSRSGSYVTLNRLASLLAPTSVSTTTSVEYLGSWLSADLYTGSRGPSVKKLQIYLNYLGGSFSVATSGPGSPGNETEYFGSLTRAALARFQKANGISPYIGYFGPITRNYITRSLIKNIQP